MNNRRSDEVVCDCVHAFAELEIFLSDVPDRNDLGKKSYFLKKQRSYTIFALAQDTVLHKISVDWFMQNPVTGAADRAPSTDFRV